MLKEVLEFTRQIFTHTSRLQRVEAEVTELRQAVARLDREIVELNRKLDAVIAAIQHQNMRIDHERENNRHEREKLLLRLEIVRVRSERQLPAGDAPMEPDMEPS